MNMYLELSDLDDITRDGGSQQNFDTQIEALKDQCRFQEQWDDEDILCQELTEELELRF